MINREQLLGLGFPIAIMCGIFSILMLAPAAVSYHAGEMGATATFFDSSLIILFISLSAILFFLHKRVVFSQRSAYALVVLSWLILPLIGAVPIYFISEHIPTHHITFLMAYFEAVSGITTTGATVLYGLDYLPDGLLIWRSILEWVGGVGVIMFAVAIIPFLGGGGNNLLRTELAVPNKDKLSDRVSGTAVILLKIYVFFTLIATLAFYMTGLSLFDSINHAMTTISIGGFSTYDASMFYFPDSSKYVAIFFMLLSSINFAHHYRAFSKCENTYTADEEFRYYISWVLFVVITSVIFGYLANDSFVNSVFNGVSVLTTSGFAASDYALYSPAFTFLLMVAMIFGACAGSTGGGIKFSRVVLMAKVVYVSFKKMLHSRLLFSLKFNGTKVDENRVFGLWGFMVLLGLTYFLGVFMLLLFGNDFLTSISAVLACISNTGPGFGAVGPSSNYSAFNDFSLSVLIFIMLAGRLEIVSLLIFFLPDFWRK